jgi:hypothetical protein
MNGGKQATNKAKDMRKIAISYVLTNYNENTNINARAYNFVPKKEQISRRIIVFTLLIVKILFVSLVIASLESSNIVYLLPTANAQIPIPSLLGEDFLTYQNSTYGIKINYSSTWEKITSPSFFETGASQLGGSLPKSENVTMVVSFMSLPFQDAFLIIVVEEGLNQTLDEAAKESIGDFINVTTTANQSESGVRFSAVKFEGPNRTTLAGNPAYQLVRTATITVPPGLVIEEPVVLEQKDLFIFTMKDQRLYSIGYTGVGAGYDNNLATAQKMIDSFEITDNNSNSSANVIS